MTINTEISSTPDVAILSHIHTTSFPKGWSAAEVADMLNIRGTYACVAQGGFSLFRLIAGEAELLTLAVLPGSRQHGIGRALLMRTIEWLKGQGASALFLEVRSGNQAAIPLYKTQGFKETGRRKGYYADPDGSSEDALTMCLTLL